MTLPGCVEPPANIDGVSVLPVLLGQEREIPDRFLYWESPSRGLRQAVRWRDWKAVRLEQGAPLELYDLATDIGEKSNVAGQRPDIVRKFEEYLKTARTESKEWPVRE